MKKNPAGKLADLHLHTVFSDGSFGPAELISEAKKSGLSTISITDHDSVDAIEEALEIGRREEIEVLPGLELSAELDGAELHILGYLFDYKNSNLSERLEVLKNNRVQRLHKILEKLKSLGMDLSASEVLNSKSRGTVGRMHIARAMVRTGLVSSTREAFSKYIGNKCPAFVLGFKFSPREAIKLIKDSGGIPVLAHPYTIGNDEVVLSLIDLGLMGLEVYYPEHSQSMVNFYLKLAKKHNLLVTGGSDCHGNHNTELKIGSISIPYKLVEELKEAKNRL